MEELAYHILDIARNSLEAGATAINITVEEDTEQNICRFTVADNGWGMSPQMLRRLEDPFFTTKSGKKVGLGFPLLRAAVEQCGGEMLIESKPGEGTRVCAAFPYNHVDRAPLGDMAQTICTLLAGNSHVDLKYTYIFNGRQVKLETQEIRKRLKNVPLDHPTILLWLRQYLTETTQALHGGDDYEIARRAG
ncbi:MAG: ATP-binding protein [Thermoanaerobacteraceae bacterium]|nr:ATP-binding protein [Thermoanaerobacteraceae bacterium]